MPYIKQDDRDALRPIVDEIKSLPVMSAGELNYLFTTLAVTYLKTHGKTYQKINDIIGALEGAKLELYRVTAAPYEDLKREENGDV